MERIQSTGTIPRREWRHKQLLAWQDRQGAVIARRGESAGGD